MPSSPVFGDAARDVRVIKVFQELESEDGAETDSHVGVPAEIVVDLESVADCSQPGGHTVQLVDRLRKHLVGYGSKGVGEENFLGESYDEAFHAVSDLLEVHGTILDLVGYVVVLDDRSRHQLGEEGDVEREFVDVSLRFNFLPIDVHDVANGLEGVEGDADGHDDLDEIDVPVEKRVDVLNKEVEVLEVEQEAQIPQDGEQKSQFGSRARTVQFCALSQEQGEAKDLFLAIEFRHPESPDVVDDDGEQHHRHIPRLAPGVEEDACQQQDIVFQLFPYQKVQSAHDRQEQK